MARLASPEEIGKWLAVRIYEIELVSGILPSIGILLPDEEKMEAIFQALKKNLDNYTAAPVEKCQGGQATGNVAAARLFSIQHIKGLEFEAAFFVDFDSIVDKYPRTWLNYLYVGATRAAKFLGMTYRKSLPGIFKKGLGDYFGKSWEVAAQVARSQK